MAALAGRIFMLCRALALGLALFSAASSGWGCRLGAWPPIASLESPDPGQRIKAIAAAADAMDHAVVPRLVDRLEDEDEAVRFYAILALERIEGTRLGYDYAQSEAQRAAGVRRWRQYVRAGEHLCAKSGAHISKVATKECR